MIPIFKDRLFQEPLADDFLWEGQEYFLDLTLLSERERQAAIDRSRLAPFVQFDARNPVCALRVSGYLGTIELSGRQFDVRSKKFALGDSGEVQFATLLSEIDRIKSGLVFHYQSPSMSFRAEERQACSPSALERLFFFLRLMDGPSPSSSIAGTVIRIMQNPHRTVQNHPKQAAIEVAKRIDTSRTIKQLGKIELRPARGQSAIVARRLTKTDFLPRFVTTSESRTSFDTAENRFLRFLLMDIEALSLTVLRDEEIPQIARLDAEALLARVRGFLADPFFQDIGKLQQIPSHSPVLNGNEGYSRLYNYYLRSRLGVADPLTSAQSQLRASPLKDVASLYEVWVFFKLAELLFDKDRPISVSSGVGDGLPYGSSWTCGDMVMSYNHTYQSGKGSYSTALRPDVSLQIGERLWLFDAKYKADHINFKEDENSASVTAKVKNIDLQKMHTYVDAIDGAHAAIAVYPGSETSLFARRRDGGDELLNLSTFGGIAGVPLLPLGAGREFEELKRLL